MTVAPYGVRDLLSAWRAARRYGVPAGMVARATERRAVGDWQGACAVARVGVGFDLHQVANRHGVQVAAAVSDDLVNLAPDLVRWHLPRLVGGGTELLRPALTVLLARYPEAAVALTVHTPARSYDPQRITLRIEPVPSGSSVEWWHTTRYLWDARAVDELLPALAGGDRAPFFERDGRLRLPAELPRQQPAGTDPVACAEWAALLQDAGHTEQAWQALGVEGYLGVFHRLPLYLQQGLAMTIAEPATRRWLSTVGVEATVLPWSGRYPGYFRLVLDGYLIRLLFEPSGRWGKSPAQPEPLVLPQGCRRSIDVELLRFGMVGLAEVHPLVRRGLFPDAPADLDYTPAQPDIHHQPVSVRCRGVWHQIGWRGGRITALSHDPAEESRERVLRSLGGAVPGCFAVTQAWRSGVGRLPRRLRQLRAHLIRAAEHGDIAQVRRALDAGIDLVGITDRRRRTLLHLIAHLGVAHLVPRLVAAGLDVNARDVIGLPPLLHALFHRADAAVVRALLDAGAEPHAWENLGLDTSDLDGLHGGSPRLFEILDSDE